MKEIQEIYMVKLIGPLEYYLRNNHKQDKKHFWCIGCKKYISEAITSVETMFGTLEKYINPSKMRDYPKLDKTTALDDKEHQHY